MVIYKSGSQQKLFPLFFHHLFHQNSLSLLLNYFLSLFDDIYKFIYKGWVNTGEKSFYPPFLIIPINQNRNWMRYKDSWEAEEEQNSKWHRTAETEEKLLSVQLLLTFSRLSRSPHLVWTSNDFRSQVEKIIFQTWCATCRKGESIIDFSRIPFARINFSHAAFGDLRGHQQRFDGIDIKVVVDGVGRQ